MYNHLQYNAAIPRTAGIYKNHIKDSGENNKHEYTIAPNNHSAAITRSIRFINTLPWDVYIIERSGKISIAKKRDGNVHNKFFTIERSHDQPIDSIYDINQIRCIGNASDNALACIKDAIDRGKKTIKGRENFQYTNYTNGKKTQHVKFSIYNILTENECCDIINDSRLNGVFYWHEEDIVLAFDVNGDMYTAINNYGHPYSPTIKTIVNRKDIIHNYETIGNDNYTHISFVYNNVSTNNVINGMWMPMGKSAAKIPIVRDVNYREGLYVLQSKENGNFRFKEAEHFTLAEAKEKYGIAETESEATNFLAYDRMRQDRMDKEKEHETRRLEAREKRLEARAKCQTEREKRKYEIESENIKREDANTKRADDLAMQARMKELQLMKMEEDKRRQERAIASDTRSNSVSLIKEIVGFGVAILGIAAIILKAKRK